MPTNQECHQIRDKRTSTVACNSRPPSQNTKGWVTEDITTSNIAFGNITREACKSIQTAKQDVKAQARDICSHCFKMQWQQSLRVVKKLSLRTFRLDAHDTCGTRQQGSSVRGRMTQETNHAMRTVTKTSATHEERVTGRPRKSLQQYPEHVKLQSSPKTAVRNLLPEQPALRDKRGGTHNDTERLPRETKCRGTRPGAEIGRAPCDQVGPGRGTKKL